MEPKFTHVYDGPNGIVPIDVGDAVSDAMKGAQGMANAALSQATETMQYGAGAVQRYSAEGVRAFNEGKSRVKGVIDSYTGQYKQAVQFIEDIADTAETVLKVITGPIYALDKLTNFIGDAVYRGHMWDRLRGWQKVVTLFDVAFYGGNRAACIPPHDRLPRLIVENEGAIRFLRKLGKPELQDVFAHTYAPKIGLPYFGVPRPGYTIVDVAEMDIEEAAMKMEPRSLRWVGWGNLDNFSPMLFPQTRARLMELMPKEFWLEVQELVISGPGGGRAAANIKSMDAVKALNLARKVLYGDDEAKAAIYSYVALMEIDVARGVKGAAEKLAFIKRAIQGPVES